jgi:hypothetical protein
MMVCCLQDRFSELMKWRHISAFLSGASGFGLNTGFCPLNNIATMGL